MKSLFAYIRVSTAKQGEHGVSLQEQRAAIERYVLQRDLQIAEWFEEIQTAAKRGRPLFSRMLSLLKQGKAVGVVIHKIDRSARNLKDWADLGELIDRGIDIHFAAESLDLHSRGGRLSADIQAVVAADYIRNLREETRKGFYGRLKQGLYPLGAPIGYIDQGKGKPKTPDPIKAALVRTAFELYASRRYGLDQLVEEMDRRGLRNRNGHTVTRNGMSVLLNNPFYLGVIRLYKTGETFAGIHTPIVTKAIFETVQRILRGKTNTKCIVHDFRFRRFLRCGLCGQTLIGELQKGHAYYRCHTRGCATKTIREEIVEESFSEILRPLRFSDEGLARLESKVNAAFASEQDERLALEESVRLRLDNIRARLGRLTDALIDNVIGREIFEERKLVLLVERADLEQQLKATGRPITAELNEYLELLRRAQLSHDAANPYEKRELLSELTSNRIVTEKNVVIELRKPFRDIADVVKSRSCDPVRDIPRTFDVVFDKINDFVRMEIAKEAPQPPLFLA